MKIYGWVDWILKIGSGEFFLTHTKFPNGGNIIFIRSAWVSIIIFIMLLIIIFFLDPKLSQSPFLPAWKTEIKEKIPWFGAIYASIYAALYSRFASQWIYLSELYNQIKAAQCNKEREDLKIAEWKAGFIEDADELHLSRKPLFASVIVEWSSDENVKKAFSSWSCGGKHGRWELIINDAKAACRSHVKNNWCEEKQCDSCKEPCFP